MEVATVILPGLAQVLGGRLSTGAKMFVLAVVSGALSSGVLWFACGAWSCWEYRRHPPRQAARLASPRSPQEDGDESLVEIPLRLLKVMMPLFMLAAAAYAVHKGIPIKTLKLLGIEVVFEGSGALARGTSRSVPPQDPQVAPAADPAQDVPRPSGQPDRPPGPKDLTGTWKERNGADYHIAQTGNGVRLKEVSKLFFIPIETAACAGNLDRHSLSLRCQTILDVAGTMQLRVSADGNMLSGTFVAEGTAVTASLWMTR